MRRRYRVKMVWISNFRRVCSKYSTRANRCVKSKREIRTRTYAITFLGVSGLARGTYRSVALFLVAHSPTYHSLLLRNHVDPSPSHVVYCIGTWIFRDFGLTENPRRRVESDSSASITAGPWPRSKSVAPCPPAYAVRNRITVVIIIASGTRGTEWFPRRRCVDSVL